MTELPAPNGIGHGLFAAGLAQANRAIEFPADGVERTTYLQGDPVIPPEAAASVIEVLAKHQMHYAYGTTAACVCGWEPTDPWVWQEDHRAHVAHAVLAAALPHLRPLFEVATQVGLELGRQEAAEEIAAACEKARELYDAAMDSGGERSYALAGTSIGLTKATQIAREVATRTADARTDPSGHTDLPPTPDAVSNRLPEGTP